MNNNSVLCAYLNGTLQPPCVHPFSRSNSSESGTTSSSSDDDSQSLPPYHNRNGLYLYLPPLSPGLAFLHVELINQDPQTPSSPHDDGSDGSE